MTAKDAGSQRQILWCKGHAAADVYSGTGVTPIDPQPTVCLQTSPREQVTRVRPLPGVLQQFGELPQLLLQLLLQQLQLKLKPQVD